MDGVADRNAYACGLHGRLRYFCFRVRTLSLLITAVSRSIFCISACVSPLPSIRYAITVLTPRR